MYCVCGVALRGSLYSLSPRPRVDEVLHPCERGDHIMGTRARVDSFPARLDRSAISSTLGSNNSSTRGRVDSFPARLDRITRARVPEWIASPHAWIDRLFPPRLDRIHYPLVHAWTSGHHHFCTSHAWIDRHCQTTKKSEPVRARSFALCLA